MPISIHQLKNDSEVREILAWPFDFDLANNQLGTDRFKVEPAAETTIVANDGSCGIFLQYGAGQHLMHITSEGAAGIIARDLTEAIQLFVTYPYWRDLLGLSGGGSPNEMRRAVPFLEREIQEDEPEINRYRSLLSARLGLQANADAIVLLYEAVTVLGSGIKVEGSKGVLRGLFGECGVDDNHAWVPAEPHYAPES